MTPALGFAKHLGAECVKRSGAIRDARHLLSALRTGGRRGAGEEEEGASLRDSRCPVVTSQPCLYTQAMVRVPPMVQTPPSQLEAKQQLHSLLSLSFCVCLSLSLSHLFLVFMDLTF